MKESRKRRVWKFCVAHASIGFDDPACRLLLCPGWRKQSGTRNQLRSLLSHNGGSGRKMPSSTLTRLLLSLLLLTWLVGCATEPRMVTQSFSCDMWSDGWAGQATLLEYSYGNQAPMLNKKASGEQGLSCGGFWMAMPTAEFLYVKWRLKATGEVIEERVDLRGLLPQNMYDHEVTFVIDGRQLYVYLVTPTKITQNLPKAPLRAWRSRYKVTYEIYPTNQLKN